MSSNIKNSKYKSKLIILYFLIYTVVLGYFYYIQYLDFMTVRTLYMPILGVCILAILLEYVLFGQIFLIASLFGLIGEYIVSIKQSIGATNSGSIINNLILILGFILGFIIQMYIKSKDK